MSLLNGGGSIVTRVSPDGADFSIVLEKMRSSSSSCARGNNPALPTNTENVTLQLRGKFAAAPELRVWYSDLSKDVGPHGNPATDKLFLELAPLSVSATGTVSLPLLKADEMYTLTVRTLLGHLSGLSVSHRKSVLCYAFVWARRALNRPKRRFPARAVAEEKFLNDPEVCRHHNPYLSPRAFHHERYGLY